MKTKLDAVNFVLASVGLSPVNSLDQASPDAAAALKMVEAVTEEIQISGRSWNRRYNVQLSPDSNGEINVPDSYVQVDARRDRHPVSLVDPVIRSGKLFNRATNTFKWDQPIYVDVVEVLPFEELPLFARRFVAIRAARRFAASTLGDANLAAALERDEAAAQVDMERADIAALDPNMLSGVLKAARRRWRRLA